MSIIPDPLFKGMTRKASVFGIPIFPLFFVVALLIMCAVITGSFTKNGMPYVIALILAFPIIGTMRFAVKHDENKFELIWLWICSRIREKNYAFWKAISYGPVKYQKRRW